MPFSRGLPNPLIEPMSLTSALAGGFFTAEPCLCEQDGIMVFPYRASILFGKVDHHRYTSM